MSEWLFVKPGDSISIRLLDRPALNNVSICSYLFVLRRSFKATTESRGIFVPVRIKLATLLFLASAPNKRVILSDLALHFVSTNSLILQFGWLIISASSTALGCVKSTLATSSRVTYHFLVSVWMCSFSLSRCSIVAVCLFRRTNSTSSNDSKSSRFSPSSCRLTIALSLRVSIQSFYRQLRCILTTPCS